MEILLRYSALLFIVITLLLVKQNPRQLAMVVGA